MPWPEGRWIIRRNREPVVFRRRHLPTQRDTSEVPLDLGEPDRQVPPVGQLDYLDPVYTDQAVQQSWQTAITQEELDASEGKYVASDKSWFIPRSFLKETPVPGDIIARRDGREYTVLDVAEAGGQTCWKCFVRDFVLVFNLLQEIDIERASVTYDAAGVAVKTFPPKGGRAVYQAIRCSVQLVSQDVAEERGIVSFEGLYQIHVQRQLSVIKEDRVRFGGVYFDIVSYENPERIDELPVLLCSQRV